MWVKALVIGGYLAVLLGIGLWARRSAHRTAEDYFLASRSLAGWVLLLTMAATNFSAFTVFGFAGAGWRSGYAFYPIMAFGTGFMAITFYLIGLPVWRVGRTHGLVTPPELVHHRFESRTLRTVFLAVMAIFTLPYIAMQPMAAGYVLEELLGLPYLAGASLVTAVMVGYTLLGGMRGVAWTDVFQGTMMFVLLLAAVFVVAAPHGGLLTAHESAASQWPELFSRPGLDGMFTPGIWLGYLLLWLLCDPMFPQLFQRFYTARSPRSLGTTMWLYPIVTGVLFLLPVTLGVLGRLSFPELPAGADTDRILPMLLSRYAPPALEAAVLAAGLMAIMSTLDAQLLTLSSMVSRDLVEPLTGRAAPAWVGRVMVALLAAAGLALAWRPPATFLAIATEAFTGLAVLLPCVVAALYWGRATAAGAVASILVGQALVAAHHFGLLPDLGTLPVVPIVAASGLALVVVSWIPRGRRSPRLVPKGEMRLGLGWWAVLLALFVLGNDFWAWGWSSPGPLGYPWWLWYALVLCVLTAVAFRGLARRRLR